MAQSSAWLWEILDAQAVEEPWCIEETNEG